MHTSENVDSKDRKENGDSRLPSRSWRHVGCTSVLVRELDYVTMHNFTEEAP